MKLRTFIWIACALNLGLVLTIVRQGDKLAKQPANAPKPTADRVPSPMPGIREIAPPATTNTAVATTTSDQRTVRWEQVESDDYLQLISNLRGVGCPDRTIRDLVTARVSDDYAAAAWEVQKAMQPGYWEIMGKVEDAREIEIPKPIEDRLEAIQAEKRTTLAAVTQQFATNKEPYRLTSERWSFLSAELREQVRDIHEQIEDTRQELRNELRETDDPEIEKDLRESIRGLNAKRTEAIKAAIGDKNWERYDATRNRSANWIRSIAGLNLAPEELQQIARQRDTLNDQRKSFPRNGTPEELDEYKLVKQEIDQQQKELLINVLGEERVQHIKRSEDGAYDTMRRVARRHGLPMDIANRAYDVKQSAQTQMKALLAQNLEPERRLKATAALLLAVKAELAGTYGDQAWSSYTKYGMDWFEELTASAEMVEAQPVQEQPRP